MVGWLVRVTRRQVLVGGALLASGGCTRASAPLPVDPDDALRAEAADRERALLSAYDALLLARPELAGRLLGLRAEHATHLEQLIGPSAPTSFAATSASPMPATPTGPGPIDPGLIDPERALAELADVERLASSAHAGASVRASRALAGLLASLAASEHTHPAVLL